MNTDVKMFEAESKSFTEFTPKNDFNAFKTADNKLRTKESRDKSPISGKQETSTLSKLIFNPTEFEDINETVNIDLADGAILGMETYKVDQDEPVVNSTFAQEEIDVEVCHSICT